MIHEILVTNSNDESLPLTLVRPETSGIIVRNVDGLVPPKSNINIRENSGKSGSSFNSARTPSRNIVLTLEFIESPTIEATRLRTYRYFPLEGRIRLDIKTDSGTFYIYGYVESNEPVIFSDKQTTIISVVCPDPFFRTESGIITGEVSSVLGLFSFPMSIAEEGFIFGERFFQTIDFVIPFIGTINVGPTLILKSDGGEVTNPRIYFYNQKNPPILESLNFSFFESCPPLEDGDYLRIVCEPQNKSVTRYVAATQQVMDYLNAVTIDSSWPILQPGDNMFSYDADSGGAYVRFGYEYPLKYAGI